MFKEWLACFFGYIITAIIMILVVGLFIGGLGVIIWIGMKSIILGISIVVVLGLIGLGIYCFYEVKKEYK